MMRHFVIFFALIFCIIPPVLAKDVLNVQDFTTPGGINVWLVEDHSIPVISVSFSFSGGLAFESEDKLGTARLVSLLLDEGAGDMNSQTFQGKLSDHAITLSFSPGRDDFIGQMRTLSTNKKLAFDLLRLAITAPRFDADALTRMKNSAADSIRDNMGDPSWLVARSLNGIIFEGHYYARPGSGTLDSLPKISREDLIGFTKTQFHRGVQVSIAGDLNQVEAAKLVDSVFAKLPPAPAEQKQDVFSLKNKSKTVLLPLAIPQTFVIMAQDGVSQHDPDWYTAVVVDYILGGGGFDARLMQSVRKERGLTYGIYSQLASLAHAPSWQVSFSTSNEKLPEALSVVRQEWKKMAEQGPTQQELDEAKAYLTGSLPLELTSTSDIASILNGLQRDGMSANDINMRNAKINAVTLEDAQRVAQRLLKPQELTTILVGDPKGVKIDLMLDHAPGMSVKPEE